MLNWLLLNPLYSVALIVAVMTAICIVPYWMIYRIWKPDFSDDIQEMAMNVGFRIGTLHALILALIFSSSQEQYQTARENIAAEVIVLSEVAYEIAEMRDEQLTSTLEKLHQYVDALQEDDASAVDIYNIRTSDIIFHKAAHISREIYSELLSIETEDAQQKITLNRIVSKLDEAFSLRSDRLASAARGVSDLFWVLAIVGFVFVLLLFLVVRFSWFSAIFVGFYGCYTGLILFFIVEMNNPYIGLSSIDLSTVSEAFDRIEDLTQ